MLPLICSMLPPANSLEAKELDRRCVYLGQSKAETNAKCDLNIRIAKILLCVAQEAANAILDARYKDFDPIVKNFGCQISAIELNEILSNERDALCDEAARINTFVQEKKLALAPRRPPELGKARSLEDYLITNAKLDMLLSPKMARLVRMRLLCIVNKDVEKEGKAVPQTDVELLCAKLGTKRATSKQNIKSVIELIVGGLQAEESKNAVCYIRQRGVLLFDNIRRPLVVQALTLERLSRVKNGSQYTQTPIMSVPLLHNTEAAIGSYRGIVCVKNKLKIADRVIEGALVKKAFIRMPEQQLVDIANLADDEPLIVIEGYINNQTDLKNRVIQVGLMNIVRAGCAQLPQYASGSSKDPIQDPLAADDIQRFASKDFQEARDLIEIDHIYCASIGEEK
jgi:hypothetical protein